MYNQTHDNATKWYELQTNTQICSVVHDYQRLTVFIYPCSSASHLKRSLSLSIFEDIEHYAEPMYAPPMPLSIRGSIYQGLLYRPPMNFDVYLGELQEVDATVFVPILHPEDDWRHPNFTGLDGFLNRIRFAVDPAENLFYFGDLG